MAYPYYGGHGPTLVKTIWALFGVATIFVGLRGVVRLTIVKSGGGWSLLWISLAYVLALVTNVLYDRGAHWGLGNHTDLVVDAPHLAEALEFRWIAANFQNFSVWFGRLSVATFIFDIQGRVNVKYRYIIIVPMACLLLLNIITIPFIFTECNPTAKLWDSSMSGKCNGIDRVYYTAIVTGAFGSLMDIILAVYPAFLLYSLKITLRLKLIFCTLMSLGLFAGACNIVETSQVNRLRQMNDPIYETAPLIQWGVIEMWVVIIAASAAPLWPLAKTVQRTSENAWRRLSGRQSTADDDDDQGRSSEESGHQRHNPEQRRPDVQQINNASESQNHLVGRKGAIEMQTQWSVRSEKARTPDWDEYHEEYMIRGPHGSTRTIIGGSSPYGYR